MIVAGRGGRKETVEGLAGLGDLLVTGWSGLSFNHRAGQRIIIEKISSPRSEGCIALPSMAKIVGKDLKKFPVLHTLKKIIVDHYDAKKTFLTIFS